mgnify:CR=1 FL=1
MKFKKVCTISIMKFELEEEHLYTLDEMKAFFGVTKDQWKKNNNELLKHLCNYYEYEIRYNQTDKRKKEFCLYKVHILLQSKFIIYFPQTRGLGSNPYFSTTSSTKTFTDRRTKV